MATSDRSAASASEPVVLDAEVVGDRMLVGVDRGEVSLAIQAPADATEEEIEAALDGVPESVVRTADLFVGGGIDVE